jgi:hypothetical protein
MDKSFEIFLPANVDARGRVWREKRSQHEKKFVAANSAFCKRLSLARCASDSLQQCRNFRNFGAIESRNIAIHGSADAAAGARE